MIVVNYPTAQPHTFHHPDDEDWVKFYGLENDDADSIEDVYTVEASNLGENCPVIELYDAEDLTIPIAVVSHSPVDGKVWIDYHCPEEWNLLREARVGRTVIGWKARCTMTSRCMMVIRV